MSVAADRRWELYKMLAEPFRLRLLALAEAEELAIGELAQLLGEGQPNVSRHLKPLRAAGLLSERKQGTRVLVRLDESAARDAVVADALRAGRVLCEGDGSLGRVARVVRARDEAARRFFERPGPLPPSWPEELAAYLTALAPLVARRGLAVDVGTGDGSFLEVLAPIFERVVGIDRAEAQLESARARLTRRGYDHVELRLARLDDPALADLRGRADAVFAARLLHHAPRPAEAFASLSELVAPGGMLLVLDYVAHEDERMREEQADVWLGFEAEELGRFAEAAGLETPTVLAVPSSRCGGEPDGHLNWQVLSARRPVDSASPTRGMETS